MAAFGTIVTMALVPFVYSYVVYREVEGFRSEPGGPPAD